MSDVWEDSLNEAGTMMGDKGSPVTSSSSEPTDDPWSQSLQEAGAMMKKSQGPINGGANWETAGGQVIDQNPQEGGMAATFMDGVENFNRQFARLAEGTLSLGAHAVGATQFGNAVDQQTQQLDQSAAEASIRSPVASAVGTGLGVVGQAALPFGAAGKGASLTKQAMAGGLAGAGYGFLNAAPDLDSRIQNGAMGFLGGSLAPVALKGYAAAINDISTKTLNKTSGFMSKVLSPNKAALNNVAYEIKNTPKGLDAYGSRSDLFNKNEVPADLSDLTGNVQIANEQNKLINTPEIQKTIASHNSLQGDLLQGKLDKTLDNFVPGGLAANKAKVSEAYGVMDEIKVDPSVEGQLMANPSIKARLDLVNQNIDLGMADTPNTSLRKLDQVKRMFDNELHTKTRSITTDNKSNIDTGEWNALNQTRKELVDTLDNAVPGYKQARQVADRVHFYEEFSKLGRNIKSKAGTENEIPLTQQYDNLFGTPEKREYFLNAVERTGGNEKPVSDLMGMLNIVKDNSMSKLEKKPYGQKSSFEATSAGPIKSIYNAIANKLGTQRYHKALIKLSLGGAKTQEKLAAVIARPNVLKRFEGVRDLLETMAEKTPESIKGTAAKIPARMGGYLSQGDETLDLGFEQ